MKFMAIIGFEEAMKAVEGNGYALQYVLCKELFVKIAAEFSIQVTF